MLQDLLKLFRETRIVDGIQIAVDAGHSRIPVAGLQGSAPRLLAASLAADRPVLFLAEDEEAVRSAAQDLSTVMDPERVLTYPGPDVLEGEILPLGWYEISHRMRVLDALNSRRSCVVIASPLALLAPTMAPEPFRKHRLTVKVGDELDRDMLIDRLDQLGHARLPKVDTMGEYSVRGGILDVYGSLSTRPFRIELFGDSVESIRSFDPATQRSVKEMRRATLVPVREVLPDAVQDLPEEIEAALEKEEKAAGLYQTLRGGKVPKGAESLLRFLPQVRARLTDHLAATALMVDNCSHLAMDQARVMADKAYDDECWPDLIGALETLTRICLKTTPDAGDPPESGPAPIQAPCRILPEYLNNQDRFLTDLKSYGAEGYTRIVAASTRGGRDRLKEILEEADFDVVPRAGRHGSVTLLQADLDQGFALADEEILLVTENDLWRDRRAKQDEPRIEAGDPDADNLRFSDFSEISEGSLVVHFEHGVGRFVGLKELRVDGVQQDYLQLEYQKGDKLFVPVNQLDRVQRYVGVSEGGGSKLSRLGSAKWSQAKRRVRKEVAELAKGLLELYAKRETVQGHSFGPDTTWQRELEGLFPFDETPDQLRCIGEVKGDLQKTRPMDRLLCGDVGYGKTEVAVRAAFKAVQEGKQVAVLVPTTILAEQHLHTFQTRMAAFPINIGCLSRLRTLPQQKTLVRGTKTGSLDILIGTHRILSKDIKFKDLGLLIVDEEQRFGVSHKEKIKDLKASVDVLTMTATPIPRTLNLAMSGARDISVITTPPRGRMPIRTYVVEYHEDLVKGAIERELARGGQIYYVYNRIESMDVASAWLKKLVPKARIRSGHGQMDRARLESLMTDFYSHEFDVLLSTTIIESGLDVPNVNTIILHRADCFGLSQLYQLRGRVGRTTRQAYAYLLYPSRSSLSGMAFERLKALEEYTDLGSGFKIAMRDLELRGAGNILGAAQHGFIDAVGFELYTRLLRESVADLKGRQGEGPREFTKMELQIDCFIPSTYITDNDSRITHYRRLAEVSNEDELQANISELGDRYGAPPESLTRLFRLMRVKMRATDLGVAGMQQKENRVFFQLKAGGEPTPGLVRPMSSGGPPPRPAVDAGKLPEAMVEWLDHVRRKTGKAFRPESPTVFSVFLGSRRNQEVLRLLEKIYRIPLPEGESAKPPPRRGASAIPLRSHRM